MRHPDSPSGTVYAPTAGRQVVSCEAHTSPACIGNRKSGTKSLRGAEADEWFRWAGDEATKRAKSKAAPLKSTRDAAPRFAFRHGLCPNRRATGRQLRGTHFTCLHWESEVRDKISERCGGG